MAAFLGAAFGVAFLDAFGAAFATGFVAAFLAGLAGALLFAGADFAKAFFVLEEAGALVAGFFAAAFFGAGALAAALAIAPFWALLDFFDATLGAAFFVLFALFVALVLAGFAAFVAVFTALEPPFGCATALADFFATALFLDSTFLVGTAFPVAFLDTVVAGALVAFLVLPAATAFTELAFFVPLEATDLEATGFDALDALLLVVVFLVAIVIEHRLSDRCAAKIRGSLSLPNHS